MCWLWKTDYGNPIYEGGGGYDLGSGFPTSETALKAWDAWVAALVEHFRDRVQEWSIWNEPDWQKGIIPQDIAHFNIRTAAVIRQHQPDARIAGLSLSRPDQLGWFEWSLKTLQETDTEDWFDSYIYHSYHYNPDDGNDDGVRLKLLMKRFGFKGRIRQGESGCPSEATEKFALNGYPWSELTQAKWDLRRYIGDFCDGVPSNVFTICDFNHIGRQINRKGLLMADENHQVICSFSQFSSSSAVNAAANGPLSSKTPSPERRPPFSFSAKGSFIPGVQTVSIWAESRIAGASCGPVSSRTQGRPGTDSIFRQITFRSLAQETRYSAKAPSAVNSGGASAKPGLTLGMATRSFKS